MSLEVADLKARLSFDTREFTNGAAKVQQQGAAMEKSLGGVSGASGKTAGALNSELTAATKKAEAAAHAFTDEAGRTGAMLGTLRSAATAAGAGLATAGVSTGALSAALALAVHPVTLIVGGLAAVTLGAIAAANAMASNAKEVRALMAVSGLTSSAAANLADSFKLLGHDSSIVTNALFRLGDQIAGGGQALTRLGVSLFDTAGALKTEGDLFLEVRDRISQMSSASARSAALMDIFGRAGRDLASTFALTSAEFAEFQKRAEALSPWNAKLQSEATAYSRAVTELGLAWDGLVTRVGAAVTPILTSIVQIGSGTLLWIGKAIDTVTTFFGLMPDLAADAKKAAEGMKVPLAIQLEMEKASADERLRQRNAYVDLVVDAEKAAAAAGVRAQTIALRTELDGLGERQAAQEEWYKTQAALLSRGGDQFGQEMQKLRFMHKGAMDDLFRQSEAVRNALRTAGIAEDIARIEMSISAAADAERKFADAFKQDLPALSDQARLHIRVLDEIGQTHRRFDVERTNATLKRVRENTDALAQINGAEKNLAVAHAQYEQQKAQASGDYFGFIKANLAEQTILQGSVWDGIRSMVVNVFQSGTAAFSDFLFNFITGTATAADAFINFGKAMLRTLTDFLAQQIVKQVLSLGAGIVSRLGFSMGGLVGTTVRAPGPTDTVPALLTPGELVIPHKIVSEMFSGDFSGLLSFLSDLPGNISATVAAGWDKLTGLPSAIVDTLASIPDKIVALFSGVSANFAGAGGGLSGVSAALFGMTPQQLHAVQELAGAGGFFGDASKGTAGLIGSGGLSTGASTLTAGNAALMGAALAFSLATNDSSTTAGQISNAAAISSTLAALAAMAVGIAPLAATGVGVLAAAPMILGSLFGKGGIWGGRGEEFDVLEHRGINQLGASLAAGTTPSLDDLRALTSLSPELAAAAVASSGFNQNDRIADWMDGGASVSAIRDPLARLLNPENLPNYDPVSAAAPEKSGFATMGDYLRDLAMNPWRTDPSLGVASFAEGGIVTEPTLAMIGERGPEAVVPLDEMGGGLHIIFDGKITLNDKDVTDQVLRGIKVRALGGDKGMIPAEAIYRVSRS